ncbi:RimK family alpha-L-glutamate ligase [Burkholderia sp. L27(2015)]|uniref:ATP-grasp domain-containing protein n=1 Tax=Burkholderia sp. L27(2015) TaxID=1641858 RepID=UPI00131BE06D|nr:RimK family alpha-L-glutamate ligase [Burkholderia sp. L27(2015)]
MDNSELPLLDPAFTAHVSDVSGTGLSSLWSKAFSGHGVAALGEALIERVRQRGDPHALLDLSNVLQLEFQRDTALKAQAMALNEQRLYRVAESWSADALHLLVLKAAGDLMCNTPFELLLDDYDLIVDVLYVDAGLPLPAVLPDHDVLWVVVAESDANRVLLEELGTLLAHWPRPVLNQPALIARLSRDVSCMTLSDAPGVMMPKTVRVSRIALEQLAAGVVLPTALLAGMQFPLIARPVGSHAGSGLVKIECAEHVNSYLEEQSAATFFLSPFIDYASKDGLFRKFRLVLIDGKPYLCHMGISEHWMVHYPYEEMIAQASRRAEEASVMTLFERDFAQRHALALGTIQQRIGLDYWGLDCAETPDGRLLIFEVTSAMLIHRMDPTDVFAYKAGHMTQVFAACYRLLELAAGRLHTARRI